MRWAVTTFSMAFLGLSVSCVGHQAAPGPKPSVPTQRLPDDRKPAVLHQEASEPIRPCPEFSTDRVSAEREFESIDDAIQRLVSGQNMDSVLRRLTELGKSPCFDIGGRFSVPAAPGSHTYGPDSVLSLKHYWENGGRSWMQGFLRLAGVPDFAYFLSTEPVFQPTLSRESVSDQRLRPLLCSEMDEGCVQDTAGYRLRATHRFNLEAERERLASELSSVKEGADMTRTEDCEALLAHTPDRLKFTRWL